MESYDVTIIGAGVVGCAVAREASRLSLRIAVLEKELDVACGNSSRNTGMLHAGFTYKPGAIYVFVMSDKPVREHVVHTLRKAKENGILYNIQNIELLGQSTPVRWKQDKDALRISFAGDVDRSLPLCLKVSVD